MKSLPHGKPVIFFDGVCGLCNKFVDFVLEKDREKKFLFSPLQGETAAEILTPLSEDFREWDIVYADENGVHRASDATLKILGRMGGGWSAAGVLIRIPKFIRNFIYRYVAVNRYKWFGKSDTCRVSAENEADRFLP